MISVNNLSFHYGKKTVLNSLNLELKKGNIYGLLGRNGAGKTTLLKLISGQLFPPEGDLAVIGHTPAKRHPSFLSDVFYIPEEFHLPAITGDLHVKLNAPYYPRFDHDRFESYLREFEIPGHNGKLTELSYGQKKKYLLAFGLASGTSLLLLDEPTNGLDIPSKTQFRRTVASALSDDRIILISTHQVRDMEHLIDPLIIIDEGALFLNAPLETVSAGYVMEKVPPGLQPEDSLYCESVPGGQISVRARREGDEESALDLEILFNFILSRGGSI